jgi:hypothetical protein
MFAPHRAPRDGDRSHALGTEFEPSWNVAPDEKRHNGQPDVLRQMGRRRGESDPAAPSTVEGIVTAVTKTVPGAEDAGVSVREGAQLRTVAATSELVQRLNGIEHHLGQGPCVQTALEHRVYRIDDMALETRWPRFAAAAAGAGIQSMLGYRLFITGRTLGALDLYFSKPNASTPTPS